MIEVTPDISLREDEIEWDFIRASGPGGQRVNRVASAVQLRYDVAHSEGLPEGVRSRLMRMARNQISKEGILIVEARQRRSQERNRQAAMEKLLKLIRRAAREPNKRIKTRPTRAAQRRRLRDKRKRAEKKRYRQPPRLDE
jgi:ribosome-associated protein